MKKFALVLPSGGMTSSWAVGGVLALKDYYGLDQTTIAETIASSGSTGTAAYMTAGQYDCLRPIWEKFAACREFINFRRWRKVLNIDYLIDEIFKVQCPLNDSAVRESQMELVIPATHAITGMPRYFSNWEDVDIFEVL